MKWKENPQKIPIYGYFLGVFFRLILSIQTINFMKNKTNILSKPFLLIFICGGISCTTNLEAESPVNLPKLGAGVFEGTLQVESFDRYENLITGKDNLGELAFVSF